jgi:hypothetical protein
MSNPKIEVSANKQAAAASKNVSSNLESVKDTIRKTNESLNVLTRSMQTFGRVSEQTLKGVGRGFSDMFKNANREADALINKMERMRGLFGQAAPTLFGPNGQVVVGPGAQQPGSMAPPAILGPNGAPANTAGGSGGAGTPPGAPGTPGNNNNNNNQNQQAEDRRKYAQAAAIAGGAIRFGAKAFSAFSRLPLEEVMNDASKASFFGDMRQRLTSGDLTDLMLMQRMGGAEKFGEEAKKMGDNARKAWYAETAAGMAGDAAKTVAGTVGAVNGAPTGGMALEGAVGLGGKLVDAGLGFASDRPGAASAESMKAWLEGKKASDPTFVQTMQDLGANGQRRLRNYNLFGSNGETATDAQNRFKDLADKGSWYGMGEGDVASMQENLARMVGSTRGNELVEGALGSETKWGVSRDVGAGALASLDKGGVGNSADRLESIFAKGFVRGFKDSKFKEDIAAVVAEHSAMGGRTGEGALQLAGILQDVLGGKVDAYSMDAARGGLRGLNSYWTGSSGGVESTNFAKISAIAQASGGNLATAVGLQSATLPELMGLATNGSGGSDALRSVLGENAQELAKKAISAKTDTLLDVSGAPLGGDIKDKKSLLEALQRGDPKAEKFISERGMMAWKTGALGSGVQTADEATYMLKQSLAATYGGDYAGKLNESERAAKERMAGQRADETNAGATAVGNARAFLDVLEKAGAKDMTEGLRNVAAYAKEAAHAMGQMAKNKGRDPAELMDSFVTALGAAVDKLNGIATPNLPGRHGATGSWLGPVPPMRPTPLAPAADEIPTWGP